MYLKKLIINELLLLFLLLQIILFFCLGKDDSRFKFGPLYPPHDKFIISDFDKFAIHYCGLKGSVFLTAHCIFHGLIDTLKKREVIYEDYEKIIQLVLQKKNYNSPTKLILGKHSCENNVAPYTPLTRLKGTKAIKGIKISSPIEDFCKFSTKCMENNPKTLIEESSSKQQEYLEKWFNLCTGSINSLDFLFASKIDLQISKLKLKQMEKDKLCMIGAKISNETPDKRVSICMQLIDSEEICSSVSPYKPNFNGWFQQPIDPLKNVPFKFDLKTMVDERIKKIVKIQINNELPPYCIPQEIFSFKPPKVNSVENKLLFLYTDLTLKEKFLINHFLMHFVVNHGKIPRVIFNNRAKFAIEGWLFHKNKFPIISTHNAMYSIGRKLQYKENANNSSYNDLERKGTYPYKLPQFSVFSTYTDKTHNFFISDNNPLILPCLKEGCAYFIGRSINLLPVMVIRLQNILSMKNFKQSSASFISMFMMSFAEEYLFYPGKVETLDLIIDSRGVSLSNFSTLIKIRPIIKYWQEEGIVNMYPLKFNNIFVVQSSEIWGTIKDILGRTWLNETINRVKVISNVPQNPKNENDIKNLKLLWKYMSPYIIETDLGGVRPRLESGQFYPFKIYPGPFKPFNMDFMESDSIPSLSDWPKPDFNSPKNLYQLVPPEIFLNEKKTLDGNEDVVFVDWSKSKILELLPKELWPNEAISSSDTEAKNTTFESSNDQKFVSEDLSEKNRLLEVNKTSDVTSINDKDNNDLLNSSSHLKSIKNNIQFLSQLHLIQKLLLNLKKMYFLELKRNEITYLVSEQCLQLTNNHIVFFSNLIKKILSEINQDIRKSKKKYLSKSLLKERKSIIEVYMDIISTIKLKETRNLLSNDVMSNIEIFKAELDKLEADINRINKFSNNFLKSTSNKDTMHFIWNPISNTLSKLNDLRSSILKARVRIGHFNKKIKDQCEYLTSSINITKSFIEHYNKYDSNSMVESSLLLSMVNSLVKSST